ncbi:hypothetical protein RM530_01460 [Algiphilus sp. W345]|uniref:Uncharacterized protein n=1 Tax=Banduia mediterranea TaxID=3075609 RepID=A0ABU2WEI7_9GAMM|nr:hypothetical protein [Algiphilus sp. W345]MDT0496034.1 hypothetical protein [Algiphilus sp. W345]
MMIVAALLVVFDLAVHAMVVRTSHSPDLIVEEARISLFSKVLNVLPLILWLLTVALTIYELKRAASEQTAWNLWTAIITAMFGLTLTLILAAAPLAFSSAPDFMVKKFTSEKSRLSMTRSKATLDGIRSYDSVEVNTISSRVLSDDSPASRVFSIIFPVTLFGASEVEQEIALRITDIISTPAINNVGIGLGDAQEKYRDGRSRIAAAFKKYKSRSESYERSILVEQLRADSRLHWSTAYAAIRSDRSASTLSNPAEVASYQAIAKGISYDAAFSSLRPILEREAMNRWRRSAFGSLAPSLSSSQFFATSTAKKMMQAAVGDDFQDEFMRYRQLTTDEIYALLTARAVEDALVDVKCYSEENLHVPGGQCYAMGLQSSVEVISPLILMTFSLIWIFVAASELIGELLGKGLGVPTGLTAILTFVALVVLAPLVVGQFSNYSEIQIAVLEQLADDVPALMLVGVDWVMSVEPALEYGGLWLYDHAGIGRFIEITTSQ